MLGERSCFYVSDVGWLVVEMGVLHSIVEEGEGAWLGICFDRRSLAYVTKENSVIFTEDILIKDYEITRSFIRNFVKTLAILFQVTVMYCGLGKLNPIANY